MNYNYMIKLINLPSGVRSYRVTTLQSEWEQAECVFALINVGCVCVWSLMSVYPLIGVRPSVHLPVCVRVCRFTASVICRNKLILSTKQLCYLIPSSPCIIVKHTHTHVLLPISHMTSSADHSTPDTPPQTHKQRLLTRCGLQVCELSGGMMSRQKNPLRCSTWQTFVFLFLFLTRWDRLQSLFSGRSKVS